MPHITLSTDFGTRQGSGQVMHGVIYGICPDAVITDLTHEIPAFDIMQGGFLLANHAFWFPAGTVHVIVVDPGVGTERRPMAARVGDHVFVGPDNGVLSWVYHRADERGWGIEAVHLAEDAFWLPHVSRTFHGRDVFAPVAAHLAAGVPLEALGPGFGNPVRHQVPGSRREGNRIVGEVIYVDPFGSAICSILPEDVAHLGMDYDVELCGARTELTVRTFGDSDLGPDHLLALWDSSGYLLVSENNGTGGVVIRPKSGDAVTVIPRA